MFIYSHNRGESVSLLKDSLGARIIATKNSKFKGNNKKVVLNWGASSLPDEVLKCKIINHPDAIKKAVNKVLTFETLNKDEVSIVPYSTKKEDAEAWINDGKTVVVRHIVNGYGGEGIELVEFADKLPDAPLYTMYVPKKEEYRIHVINGEAVFIQRKARDKEVPDEMVNWKIRNHGNGFIFAHKDVVVDDEAKHLAVSAIKSLGLDFGSVDIIYNSKQEQYYVLEVNTASGLVGKTLEIYTEKLLKMEELIE